jgi:hypothetical protein
LTIGGSGRTGGRISALLEKRGIRSGAARDGVVFHTDLTSADAKGALARLTTLAPGQELERVVLLSGRGEPALRSAEAMLRDCGVAWTIVRAGWLNQTFSEGYLRDGVLAGEVALPADAVPEPFVDADDVAEVLVAALTEKHHANQLYEVTGPRALTFAQAVGEIAVALGRPIRYTRIPPDDFIVSLRAYAAEDIAQRMHELLTVLLDGRNAGVTDGVAAVLGRPPRDFSEYARLTAASGVWEP